MAAANIQIEKLVGSENWSSWCFALKAQFELENLWSCIEGTCNDATKETQARCRLILTLHKDLYVYVQEAVTAKEIFEKLKNLFQDSGLDRRIGLLRKLCSIQLTECNSVEHYVSEVVSTAQKLKGIGFNVSDEWIASILLKGLPSDYNPMIMSMECSGKILTADAVKSKLLQDVRFESQMSNSALVSKKQNKKIDLKNIKCFKCKKYGHYATKCPNKDLNKNQSMFAAYVAKGLNADEWYFDSGASTHLVQSKTYFTKFQNYDGEIRIANNRTLKVTGKGTIVIEVSTTGGSQKVTIDDVLYVPQLGANLLSISEIIRRNKKVVFNKNGCSVLNENNQLVASGLLVDGMYKLCIPTNPCVYLASDSSSFEIWHKRLGHVNEQSMKIMKSDGMIKYGCPVNLNCLSCAQGKHAKSKFPKEGSRASDILEIVHTDLCGPMEVQSNAGNTYMLTFTDDFSRKVFTYFLKNKTAVFNTFVNFKTFVENQSGKKLKCLRSDNGSEFVNKKMSDFLLKHGIMHQKSVVYNPQQNGIAERMNRSLVEKARCMLYEAKLPKRFWAEAVFTAGYLINRIPHRITKKCPDEIWYCKKPNLSHLRVFGCKAMVHIPHQKRRKLDAKSTKMVFIGYCNESKGYRLYDPIKKNVTISRDVIFFEEEFMSLNSAKSIEEYWFSMAPLGSNGTETEETTCSTDNGVDNDSLLFSSFAENENEVGDSSNNENITNLTTENDEIELEQQFTVPRRSERLAKQAQSGLVASYDIFEDPLTYEEAISRPDKDKWLKAINSEINSLKINKTWTEVNRSSCQNTIKTKWVFKIKNEPDGKVRYKARLVVKGYTQKKGINYEETYSPVVRYSSLRMLIALAAKYSLEIEQMDVITAFLQGELNEEIFIHQPEGVKCSNSTSVLKLNKALYGLKQASLVWNNKLDQVLIKIGFMKSKIDPCVYYRIKENRRTYLAIYVDDMLMLSNDSPFREIVKSKLCSEFHMKLLGEAKKCLNIRITKEDKRIYLDQEEYIDQILQKYNMIDCNAVKVPMDPNQKLKKQEDNVNDIYPYQQAIGSLMYLTQCTRPDICHAVSYLSRFNNNPSKEHWNAVKRVFRYLKGTKHSKLCYSQDGNNELIAYSDADWANDIDERKSITGYTVILQSGAISWSSKKQQTVALSTTEAEYMALSAVTQEVICLRGLFYELNSDILKKPTEIFCDNRSALALSSNNVYRPRSKHIDVRHHFVREKKSSKEIDVLHIGTNEMIADALTKALSILKHKFCFKKLGLIP